MVVLFLITFSDSLLRDQEENKSPHSKNNYYSKKISCSSSRVPINPKWLRSKLRKPTLVGLLGKIKHNWENPGKTLKVGAPSEREDGNNFALMKNMWSNQSSLRQSISCFNKLYSQCELRCSWWWRKQVRVSILQTVEPPHFGLATSALQCSLANTHIQRTSALHYLR